MRQINKILFRTNIQSSVYTKKEVPLAFMDLELNGKTERVEIKLFEHINPETSTNFKKLCEGFMKPNGEVLSFKGKKFVNRLKGYFMETEEINESIYGNGYLCESYAVRFDRPWLIGVSKYGDPSLEKNASGFFVTFHEMPGLDDCVAVGEVVSGQEAFLAADRDNAEVTIADCGIIGKTHV